MRDPPAAYLSLLAALNAERLALVAAMSLGIIFTLVVGCGLMALMFYSSRRGYDDRVSDLSDNDKH